MNNNSLSSQPPFSSDNVPGPLLHVALMRALLAGQMLERWTWPLTKSTWESLDPGAPKIEDLLPYLRIDAPTARPQASWAASDDIDSPANMGENHRER
jgi:hypothetical protein